MNTNTIGPGTARRQVPNIAAPGAMTMEAAAHFLGLDLYPDTDNQDEPTKEETN